MSQMRASLVGIVTGTEQVVLQMTAEGGDRRGVPIQYFSSVALSEKRDASFFCKLLISRYQCNFYLMVMAFRMEAGRRFHDLWVQESLHSVISVTLRLSFTIFSNIRTSPLALSLPECPLKVSGHSTHNTALLYCNGQSDDIR